MRAGSQKEINITERSILEGDVLFLFVSLGSFLSDSFPLFLDHFIAFFLCNTSFCLMDTCARTIAHSVCYRGISATAHRKGQGESDWPVKLSSLRK